jgi:hypothetical protein
MSEAAFFGTNVLVYARDPRDPRKRDTADYALFPLVNVRARAYSDGDRFAHAPPGFVLGWFNRRGSQVGGSFDPVQ